MTDNTEKLQQQAYLRSITRASEFSKDANLSAVDAAMHTLKTLVWINGGAIFVALGFISAMLPILQSENISISSAIERLSWPIIHFVGGLSLAVLSMGLSYLTNYEAAGSINAGIDAAEGIETTPSGKSHSECKYWIYRSFSVLFAVISLFLFCYGFWSIRTALVTVFS